VLLLAVVVTIGVVKYLTVPEPIRELTASMILR
jgi:hypothetical protein